MGEFLSPSDILPFAKQKRFIKQKLINILISIYIDMDLIKPFKQISKSDTSIAGGKGASLGEMFQAGIPVPDGFVILSTTFDRFIEETDLNVELDAILDKVRYQDISSVENASEEIKGLILNAKMPKDIAKDIENNFSNLGSKFVAVRSSATSEDSSTAAWAGQLESYLNTTDMDLLENVKKCWASLFTPRAIFYRKEKNLHKSKISVAVVVQKMVDSECSGIAFSVHPVTQDENQIIIEAGFGLGEAIVSGQITPDSYVVEKKPRRIIDKNVIVQERALYRGPKGGNEWKNLSKEIGEKQELSDKEILELAEIILRIEKHYGFPCDIEWAREKGKFYIVQSRPITTLENKGIASLKKSESNDPWILAQEIPKMTLLFFCMVHYMAKWWPKYKLTDSFDEVTASFEGTHVKMYCKQSRYSNAAKEVADKILKNPSWALKQLYKTESLSKKFILNAERLVHLIGSNRKELSAQFKKTSRYNLESQVFGSAFTWLTEARYELVTKRLIEVIQEQIKKTNSKENPIAVFNTLTKSEKKSHSFNEEMDFLNVIKSIQANSKIKNRFLEDDEEALTQYALEKKDKVSNLICNLHKKWCWLSYGYTGPEKKVGEYIRDLKKAIKEDLNPEEVLRNNKNKDIEFLAKQKEMLEQLKFDKTQIDLINFIKESSFTKDYRKGAVYHGMYCYKRFFDYISKEIGIDSGSFWHMNPFEIEDLLEKDVKISLQELRKRAEKCVVIYRREDVTFLFDKDAKKVLDAMVLESAQGEEGELKGMPVCMGFVRGKAKLIESTDDLGKMEKGDILVSHITYPNLLPAMKKAAAIVTNIGGVICHAAIIARELNIPCIVGTKFATKKIKDGDEVEVDEVEVDANKGIVRIINKK
jgi:pyruvate,water dikinase